jgi:purine-binding chemotaxis protein CheW
MNNDKIPNQQEFAGEVNSRPLVRQLQLLGAGAFQFGIFADDIAIIAGWRKPTPLPQAAESVLGVVSIQGRMLTVLDLAALTGRGTASNKEPAQHLVALRGDEQLALAIDSLGEIIEIAETDLNAKGETETPLFLGVVHRDGVEINVLNLDELFAVAIQGRERRRRRF